MTAAYEPTLPDVDVSLWHKCKWWCILLGLVVLGVLLGCNAL